MNFIKLILVFSLCGLTSCSTIFKTILGLKNPKVLEKEEILSELNSTFSKDTTARVVDYRYIKMTDSADQARMIISSLSFNEPMFNSQGQRWCYTGNRCKLCSFDEFDSIVKDNYKVLKLCGENYLRKVDSTEYFKITKLEKLTQKIQFIYPNQSLPKANLYAIFYWSEFTQSKKKKRERFDIFISKIKQIDTNFCILRINSDFTSDYYEKRRAKFRIEKEGKTASLIIDNLPKVLR